MIFLPLGAKRFTSRDASRDNFALDVRRRNRTSSVGVISIDGSLNVVTTGAEFEVLGYESWDELRFIVELSFVDSFIELELCSLDLLAG
jgi:hypothetical protein